jgi:hypothetical protein
MKKNPAITGAAVDHKASWWWRKIPFTSYSRSKTKGGWVSGVVSFESKNSENINDAFQRTMAKRRWRRHELASWRYELVRREFPSKERIPWPDLRASIQYELSKSVGRPVINDWQEAIHGREPEDGFALCNVEFRVAASERQLIQGFKNWLRKQRSRMGIPVTGQPKTHRRMPLSWEWVELLDGANNQASVSDLDQRTVLHAKEEAKVWEPKVAEVFRRLG